MQVSVYSNVQLSDSDQMPSITLGIDAHRRVAFINNNEKTEHDNVYSSNDCGYKVPFINFVFKSNNIVHSHSYTITCKSVIHYSLNHNSLWN